LKGDMSFVGPRPLLIQYLPRYSADQMRRHLVRPGITGLAQVQGRNVASWEGRLAMDTWYVDHCGLWLDVKIMVRTIYSVLSGANVTPAGRLTMEEFKGSNRA